MARRKQEDVALTRAAVLERAVDLASVEGLEALTLGRLASATKLSKSGLFAHFGSKEALQLAVLESAFRSIDLDLQDSAAAAAPGLERLIRLAEAWCTAAERGLFRGGSFVASASLEFDDRPGRLRDVLVERTAAWIRELEDEAGAAIEAGELGEGADPAQIAFEIHAFALQTNWAFQLHGSRRASWRARIAAHRLLRSVATERGLELLDREDH